ncbi:hypothetical protein AAG906_006917 [Vitis piasezkii]
MPTIRVLDLSNNFQLMELHVEIGDLVTLQYLNLSHLATITYLPVELKNLTKLRCLILNDMIFLMSSIKKEDERRYIHVYACPSLRKLPFDSNTGVSKKVEEIKGKQEWWDDSLALGSRGAIRLRTTARKQSLNLHKIQKPKCRSSKEDMAIFSSPHKPRIVHIILIIHHSNHCWIFTGHFHLFQYCT